jgi:hypothetical protein
MKRLRYIVLITLAVVVQFVLVLQFTLHEVNLAKIPYRRAERAAAARALAQDQSPENKAALQEESRLAGNYVARQQFTRAGVIFAVLLSIEGIVIYVGRKHESKYKAVA